MTKAPSLTTSLKEIIWAQALPFQVLLSNVLDDKFNQSRPSHLEDREILLSWSNKPWLRMTLLDLHDDHPLTGSSDSIWEDIQECLHGPIVVMLVNVNQASIDSFQTKLSLIVRVILDAVPNGAKHVEFQWPVIVRDLQYKALIAAWIDDLVCDLTATKQMNLEWVLTVV